MLDSMPRANAQVLTLVLTLNPGSNSGSDLCAAKGGLGWELTKVSTSKEALVATATVRLLATKKEE